MPRQKPKSIPEPGVVHRAMERLAASRKGEVAPPASAATDYRQELAIHEIELELQNEELRAARLELEAGLDRYTQLFDFAPIGYATLTADGTMRELNHVGASLLYESRSRLIGKRFGLFVALPDRPMFNELLEKALKSDQKETREIHLISVTQDRPVVRLTAVTLARTEPTVLIAFEDISAQKRAEDRLMRADLELREADRRKDEFLAVLSHELRTPLSTLLMYGQLLHQGAMDSEKVHKAADAIERAARVQARLIDDLLDISRIVAGKMIMQFERVNFASVALAALEAVGKQAEKKGISIERVFDSAASVVAGDAERLQQVITNLLTNAIKFTPPAGRILLRLQVGNDDVRVEVEDTGAGIEPDFLPRIFERFSQADRTATRRTGGLGLGLAIARSIVLAHQGTIRAQSAGRGKGATFTISLPMGRVPQAVSFPPGQTSSKPAMEARIRGTRLLVVEDDDSTRETLTEVLSMAGADVRGVDGGAAAMLIMNDFHPDVLVCDIAMPEEDGCALLRRIRARGPDDGGDVPALALTAFAGDEDRQRTRAAGFENHLVKPVDIDQLLAAVSDLLPPSKELATS